MCQRQERQRNASHTLTEFVEFLRREHAGVLPVIGAIAATTTPAAAAELLGIAKPEFRGLHSRLRELGQFFLKPEMRRRRSAKPKALSNNCETSATDPVHSCSAWNRVELYNEVWHQPLVRLSRKYGISDVRLGKVCRKLQIPHPGRGYWAKRAVGQTVEQVLLPEFKDALVVKRLISENPQRTQDRASKRTLRKSLRKQFLKNRLGIRV